MKFIGEKFADISRDHHGNAEIRAAGLIITLPTKQRAKEKVKIFTFMSLSCRKKA
jgi:hypothetical protein